MHRLGADKLFYLDKEEDLERDAEAEEQQGGEKASNSTSHSAFTGINIVSVSDQGADHHAEHVWFNICLGNNPLIKYFRAIQLFFSI
mmetsp:Transcript_28368/g.60142  ORF Transcript_28368/g.60142 Transcript_28368/m.60142 type:complete len:87 (-) Transcript_28368:144-404(-)